MSMKEIPSRVLHKPKPMIWAQLATISDIKKLVENNALTELPVNWPDDSKKDTSPVPINIASTSLRRTYPYVFDCAAYVATHHPEKITESEIYKIFSIPYDVFINYCLGECNEQKEELKIELYPLIKGRPAKYIKVSNDKVVFAQPVIISLSYKELKSDKDKRIENVSDNKVYKIEVQILKKLLSYEKGYTNLPGAPYAKIRRIFNKMKNNIQPFLEVKDDYRKTIEHTKSISTYDISTEEAARLATITYAQWKILEDIEQGGFYKIYLAIEYILVNKSSKAVKQDYNFLKLCSKCAPEYVYERDGKLFYKDKKAALRFSYLITGILDNLEVEDKEAIGIKSIQPHETQDCITAIFKLRKGK